MAIIRIRRSTDSTYLCSQQGPSLLDDAERDEVTLTVHASEMTAGLAVVLTREATRVSSTHHIRRPQAGDTSSYQVAVMPCDRDDIPYGRPGHIEQIWRRLVLMYDETQIEPELATCLATLAQEAGKYCDLRPEERRRARHPCR